MTCSYVQATLKMTKRLLECIREFGKVARYKVNTEQSVAFVYNDRAEKATVNQS